MRSYYHLLRDDQIRKWWADWERVYSPRSEDKLEYVEQLKRANIAYHVPLRTVLFNPAVFCSTTDWSNSSALFANTVPFRYPEITAVATNSVRSSFNLHPPEPRLYTVEDEQLADDVGRFVRDTTVYYDVTLKALTAQALKYIIRHKVPMTGVEITSTGTKPIIINHIRDADKEFYIELHRRLSPPDEINVNRTLQIDHSIPEAEYDLPVVAFGSQVVSRRVLLSLDTAKPMTATLLNTMLELFRIREEVISKSHADINHDKAKYEYYKPSVFCPPDFLAALLNDPLSPELDQYFDIEPIVTIRRFYCVLKNVNSDRDDWKLVVIDIERKCFSLIDPATVVNNSDSSRQLISQLTEALNTFLGHHLGERRGDAWSIKSATSLTRYVPKEDDFNGGMYVITIIYYLLFDAPMVFNSCDIDKQRNKWVHWILLESLAI